MNNININEQFVNTIVSNFSGNYKRGELIGRSLPNWDLNLYIFLIICVY